MPSSPSPTNSVIMGCVGAQPIRCAEHAALQESRTGRLKHRIAAGCLFDYHCTADQSNANNGGAVSTARGCEQPGELAKIRRCLKTGGGVLGMYLRCAMRRAGRALGRTSYMGGFTPDLFGGRGGE